jgi:hypothetical protein
MDQFHAASYVTLAADQEQINAQILIGRMLQK